jgi:SAM (Sterile alpha motif) domain-containing protein
MWQPDLSARVAVDIQVWLRRLGLEQYAPAFRDNHIDAEVLPELTAEDLNALGVLSVGHRGRLLDAIAALRHEAHAGYRESCGGYNKTGPGGPQQLGIGRGAAAREDLPRFIATDGARTAKSP